VVEVEQDKAILFHEDFIEVSRQETQIISMQHTGRKADRQRLEFDDISTDSLRSLLAGHVIELKCISSLPVRYTLKGERFEKSSLEIAYLSGFDFSEVQQDIRPTIAKIEQNKAEIKRLTGEYTQALSEIRQVNDRIAYLETNMATFSAYEQGKAIDERRKLSDKRTSLKLPALNTAPLQKENALLIEQLNEKHLYTGYIILWKP
jgi:hypothetical protein